MIMSLLKEFCRFLLSRKKWWLVPLLVTLLVITLLLLFGSSPGLAPFMYGF